MKRSTLLLALAIATLTTAYAQVQTFIIHDGYFGNGTFTLVTNGAENTNAIIAQVGAPDSLQLVFAHEGRSAHMNFQKNGRFFTFEIPLYSLAYNDCAYSYSWFTEASIQSTKITTGVYEIKLDPMGQKYDNFCSEGCPTLHSLKTGTPPPPPPAMPQLFDSIDARGYGAKFHYSREDEVWYAYWYQQEYTDADSTFYPAFSIKISNITEDFYCLEPIGFGGAGSPSHNRFLKTMELMEIGLKRNFLQYFPKDQMTFTFTHSEILRMFRQQ